MIYFQRELHLHAWGLHIAWHGVHNGVEMVLSLSRFYRIYFRVRGAACAVKPRVIFDPSWIEYAPPCHGPTTPDYLTRLLSRMIPPLRRRLAFYTEYWAWRADGGACECSFCRAVQRDAANRHPTMILELK